MLRKLIAPSCSSPIKLPTTPCLLKQQVRFARWPKKKVIPILPPPIEVNPGLYQVGQVTEGEDVGVAKKRPYFPPLSSFRTKEANPAKLDRSQLGRFYTVDKDYYKTVVGPCSLYPKEFRQQSEVFNEACVMIRKPFLDVKACIEASDLGKPVVRYMLYGPPGCGKSMTMASLVHYTYVQEYVLVNVPWAPLWTRFNKEYVQSQKREGYFDHTNNSVAWLSQFKIQNTNLLSKLDLKSSKAYQWSKREETVAGSPLLDIVEHGISRPVHAAECIYSLVTELKAMSSAGRCKTAVIIDGINTWYYECIKLRRPDRSLIPPTMLTVFEAFKELIKPDWTGGLVICSVDKLAAPSDIRESDLPRYLLTKEGWEQFDPFVPVFVDKYSSQEAQSTLDYYLERKWLQHPLAGSEEGRLELEYLSTRNPLVLMDLCNSR